MLITISYPSKANEETEFQLCLAEVLNCNFYFTLICILPQFLNPLPCGVMWRFFVCVRWWWWCQLHFKNRCKAVRKAPMDTDVHNWNWENSTKPFHARTQKSFTYIGLILVSLPNACLQRPEPTAVKELAQNIQTLTSGSLSNVYIVAINQVIILSSVLFISYLSLFNDLFTLWLIYKLLLAHQAITKIVCLKSSLSKGQGNLRNLVLLNQSSCTSFSNRDDKSLICRPGPLPDTLYSYLLCHSPRGEA